MRVTVHHPARTDEDGTEVPESVTAFRLGKIEDQVNHVTGETTPAAEVAVALVEQAKAEFPGQDVKIEFLHDNGDGTSSWKGEAATSPLPAGEQHEQTLNVAQSQEAGQ